MQTFSSFQVSLFSLTTFQFYLFYSYNFLSRLESGYILQEPASLGSCDQEKANRRLSGFSYFGLKLWKYKWHLHLKMLLCRGCS